MAWLLPKPEDGAEPVLKPLDELELLELPVLLELLELSELSELFEDELGLLDDEDELELFAELEPVDAGLAV